jgi:hypothetical protein
LPLVVEGAIVRAVESPATWDLLTATLSWLNPNAAPEAALVARCHGLIRADGADTLSQVIVRERAREITGPSFAARVAHAPELEPFLTPRASQRDPYGHIAFPEVKRFRLGLRRRACSGCGLPSTELWENGSCPGCGHARIELHFSGTCELCQTCHSAEPVGTAFCERCGQRPGLAHDDRSPNWRVEIGSVVNHLNQAAQLPITLGVLRSAARENDAASIPALNPVLQRMREVVAEATTLELITRIGPGELWRVRRVLADLAGLSDENEAMLTLASLEVKLAAVPADAVDLSQRHLLFWVAASQHDSPYANAPAELWDAVHAASDDDAPRRVLADVLLKTGDALGEHIHLQLANPCLEAPAALKERFFRGPAHVTFDRGLPAALGCTADVFLRHDVPRSLVRLELSDVQPGQLGRVLRKLSAQPVKGLRLRSAERATWAELKPVDLPGLEHLGLFDIPLPVPAGLKSLELGTGANVDRILPALEPLETLVLDARPPDRLAPFLERHQALELPHPFRRGGPTLGRWRTLEPLGTRMGLSAFLVEDGKQRKGILFRTQWLSGNADSPREWFRLTKGTLAMLDRGVHAAGEWAVFELARGAGMRTAGAKVPPEAWGPIAHLLDGALRPFPWTTLFFGQRGIEVMPLPTELNPVHRSRDELRLFAPEAVRGQPPTPASASWGLAVQILESYGLRPVPEGNEVQVMSHILNGSMTVELPDPLAALLMRCFNRDPAQRATMAELAAALGNEPVSYWRTHGGPSDLDIARAQATPWLLSGTVYDREPIT